MTIYAQPQRVSFNSFKYQNGMLGANRIPDASDENDDIDDQISHSELFKYLTENNLTSITFKSKSTDAHSFICRISKQAIRLKLQSSIKVMVYTYNVSNNELYLNKRKVDRSFYSGFMQKLEVIAQKAMQAKVEMTQER